MQALIERGGQIEMLTENSPQNAGPEANSWQSDIQAILGLTRLARDDVAKLGLKFEAYLLDMAVTALSEQLTKKQDTHDTGGSDRQASSQ